MRLFIQGHNCRHGYVVLVEGSDDWTPRFINRPLAKARAIVERFNRTHMDHPKMSTITLSFKAVTNPDFGGFKFFVEEGNLFDIDDYAAAYKLDRSEIDAQDVHSAQDAAGRLSHGEWLEVTHEVES